MGTNISLYIGWVGARNVRKVLSKALGEKIVLPREDGDHDGDIEDERAAAQEDINERLAALSLPLSLAHEDTDSEHGNEGKWVVVCHQCDSDWIGHGEGLGGGSVDVGKLEQAIDSARELAGKLSVPLPKLHQSTQSEYV